MLPIVLTKSFLQNVRLLQKKQKTNEDLKNKRGSFTNGLFIKQTEK